MGLVPLLPLSSSLVAEWKCRMILSPNYSSEWTYRSIVLPKQYPLLPPLVQVLENNLSFAEVSLHSHNAVIILVTGNRVLQEMSRNNQYGR